MPVIVVLLGAGVVVLRHGLGGQCAQLSDDRMTDITIRGIADDTYAGFSGEARKRGRPTGKLVTMAMTRTS